MSDVKDENDAIGITTTTSQSTNSVDRRKTLKKLGIGVGVGAAWATPIVQTVVLPVHAQTTTLCLENEIACSIRFGFILNPSRDLAIVDVTATSQCNADFSGAQVRLTGTAVDLLNPPFPVDITAPLDTSGNATITAATFPLSTSGGGFSVDFTVSFVDQATYGPATGTCTFSVHD